MATSTTRVACQTGKLLTSRAVGVTVSLVLLLGSGQSWAGPPNPTPSDALGNTAGGTGALSITTGNLSTAFGYSALFYNTTGAFNTATGDFALNDNTTGTYNTASGYVALYSNVTGQSNTADGVAALLSNITGDENTASGDHALTGNTAGLGNTASGYEALYYNTTGNGNTAVGYGAGLLNTIGNNNTFIGNDANPSAGSLTNGTALGYQAGLFASNSIVLGNGSISKIYASVSTITGISDRRRKKDIRALGSDLGLDFIEKLEPVSYRFNNGDETERYGFVAQDLEQALPASLHDTIEKSEPEHGLALIERQNDPDRTYRVSYGELIAPIVKAIQELQQEITEERQQNADLRRALEHQIAGLKAQNAALRHSITGQREQVTATR
jgi:hypothetical protein